MVRINGVCEAQFVITLRRLSRRHKQLYSSAAPQAHYLLIWLPLVWLVRWQLQGVGPLVRNVTCFPSKQRPG